MPSPQIGAVVSGVSKIGGSISGASGSKPPSSGVSGSTATQPASQHHRSPRLRISAAPLPYWTSVRLEPSGIRVGGRFAPPCSFCACLPPIRSPFCTCPAVATRAALFVTQRLLLRSAHRHTLFLCIHTGAMMLRSGRELRPGAQEIFLFEHRLLGPRSGMPFHFVFSFISGGGRRASSPSAAARPRSPSTCCTSRSGGTTSS